VQRYYPLAIVDDLTTLELSRELSHHLGTVRRLRVGATLFATDGQGHVRSVQVTAVRPTIVLESVSPIEVIDQPKPQIGIAMFVPSNERLAWAIQKLTEIGVDRIDLLSSDGDRRGGSTISTAGMGRLSRIALEAAQQSERLWLPAVNPPVDVGDYFRVERPGLAILDPEGGQLPGDVTTLVVGPESGRFTAPSSIPRVSLGLPILRIETAAVAGAVILAALRASLICICDKF
jgi:16S rRNA (uracil1498-N3)-methyltransferase